MWPHVYVTHYGRGERFRTHVIIIIIIDEAVVLVFVIDVVICLFGLVVKAVTVAARCGLAAPPRGREVAAAPHSLVLNVRRLVCTLRMHRALLLEEPDDVGEVLLGNITIALCDLLLLLCLEGLQVRVQLLDE